MNPILSFIENMKLIEREKETRKLDEHAKFMLAMEAMKLDVNSNSVEKSVDRVVDVLNMPLYDVFKEPLNNISSSINDLSSSIEDISTDFDSDGNIDSKFLGKKVKGVKVVRSSYHPAYGKREEETMVIVGILVGSYRGQGLIKDNEGQIYSCNFGRINFTEDDADDVHSS